MAEQIKEKEMLIDGSCGVLGRIATFSAKQALRGNKVIILNCDKIIISGRKKDILERYKQKRERGGDAMKGPFFPRLPHDIMRRTIRGMLQYKKVQGSKAFKRITCYPDVPEKYANQKKLTFKKDVPRFMTLGELSRLV